MNKKLKLKYVLAGRAGSFVKFDYKQTCKSILGLYLKCKSKLGFR
jgi:hypothetical protein